jgi:hypothetical protein
VEEPVKQLAPIALQQSSLKGRTETGGTLQSQKNKTNPLTSPTKYAIISTESERDKKSPQALPLLKGFRIW